MNIVFLDKNKRNETTFNWGPGMKIIFLGSTHRLNMSETTAVHMKRFLKSSLKGKDNEGKKVNLNKYLKVKLKFYFMKSIFVFSELSSSFHYLGGARGEPGPCILPVQGGGREVYWIS